MRKSLIIVAAAAGLLAVPAAAGELRVRSRPSSRRKASTSEPGRRRARRSGRGAVIMSAATGANATSVSGGCKTVSVRETRPDGSVVTRTRSRC